MIKVFDDVNMPYFKEIESKVSKDIPINYEETNYYLSYIVYSVRSKIFDGNEYFDNKCDLAQSMLCHYFNNIGVINYPNMTINAITDYIVGHSFVVARFNVLGNDVNYLIDPTYIQFFRPSNCSPDRFIEFNGIIIRTPDPGYYILDEDRDIINNFNYCGYGKLDERLAMIYGNSFYNTKTMVTRREFKKIDGYVYINSFLKGKEKLSKSIDELMEMGYYLEFDDSKMQVK